MLFRKTRKANALPQPVGLHCEPHRLDRRAFLRHSGLSAGGLALLGSMKLGSVRRAAGEPGAAPAPGTVIRKNVCTHCSVGCTVIAEVQNGIWIRQQPAWESPINRGTHCAKGAAIREVVQSDRRLKYPLKLAGGQRTRVSWDQAIAEIGDKMLAIRAQAGADSVYMIGPAKMTNEGAYLFRKFGAPVVGLLWPYLSRIGVGRLPGDIVIERDNVTLYFPLMTCFLLSLLFSLVLWVVNR